MILLVDIGIKKTIVYLPTSTGVEYESNLGIVDTKFREFGR